MVDLIPPGPCAAVVPSWDVLIQDVLPLLKAVSPLLALSILCFYLAIKET